VDESGSDCGSFANWPAAPSNRMINQGQKLDDDGERDGVSGRTPGHRNFARPNNVLISKYYSEYHSILF
jgi:hypothetical protein